MRGMSAATGSPFWVCCGVGAFCEDPSVEFAEDHKTQLAAFQGGDPVFTWGLDKVSGALWHLDDDTAIQHRAFVKEQVVCPAPGCGADLTTVHNSAKRDGLRHLAGPGGHSPESIFHSQGCAIIQAWLAEKYPKSVARREEYTNKAGERRADVLLTATDGTRVAFEVQYSALTVAEWKARHDSYRGQGIVDVWLFGHTSKQLKLDAGGFVAPTAVHEAVVASGSPLLFINPAGDEPRIGVVSGMGTRFDAATGPFHEPSVPVLNSWTRPELLVHPLSEFSAHHRAGLNSESLAKLHTQTVQLQQENAAAKARAEEAQRERDKRKAARQHAMEERRAPQQGRIRQLLGTDERWGRSEALGAINAYFGEYLRGRIDFDPNVGPGRLVHWQCVIYFDLIAGQSAPFNTRMAFNAIKARGVNMGQPNSFTIITRYLHELEDAGYLQQVRSPDRFPRFAPTNSGAWW